MASITSDSRNSTNNNDDQDTFFNKKTKIKLRKW